MLLSLVQKHASKLGIDRAILYTSSAKIIQAGGGVFTIFFIATFLTSDEQGYYYTFGSILAIQIFFELGLGGIITQYVAYEAAHLKLEGCTFKGHVKYLSRLSSLLHLFIKWYLAISLLLLAALIIAGFVFFSRYGVSDAVNWTSPWIILCIASASNLFISPLIAFVEGIGKVKEIALLRLITQLTSILLVWGILIFGGKLYASGFTAVIGLIISVIFLWRKTFFRIFINLWKQTGAEKINYKKEIFPYQWKIALSWLSGYFIFQLFNPVLFAYSGAKVAGQMGMTLAALNGILSLVLSWTSTKVPLWSSYISKSDFANLDTSFNRTLKSSALISICCVVFFLAFLGAIPYIYFPLSEQFLPIVFSAALSLTIIINNIVNAWATYLRCHKKEPFLIQSLIVGAMSAASTFLLGKFVGVEGVVFGYTCIIFFISLPAGYYIFKTKKREWHGK